MLSFEIFAWIGTAAILLAYGGVSMGYFDSKHISYHLLNLFGALGISIISFVKGAYQPAVLNAVWFLIALVALGQLLFNKYRKGE